MTFAENAKFNIEQSNTGIHLDAWLVDLQLIKRFDDYIRACTMFSDQH